MAQAFSVEFAFYGYVSRDRFVSDPQFSIPSKRGYLLRRCNERRSGPSSHAGFSGWESKTRARMAKVPKFIPALRA
jgi:hypothetical protein